MRERGRRDERKGWSGNNAAVRYLQLRLRTALAQPPLPTSALPIGSSWEQMPYMDALPASQQALRVNAHFRSTLTVSNFANLYM